MPYVDYAYYKDIYKGTLVTEEQFNSLAERASDIIDMVTSFKLLGVDISLEHQIIQTNVKKAVATQIEYMVSHGGELTIHGGSPSSVSIGNFSYSSGNRQGQSDTSREQQIISPAVMNYLRPTGLLYKGIDRL